MPHSTTAQQAFAFGPNFLRDHAVHIISDPRVAIIELVANAYDAGAPNISIRWPGELGGEMEVLDDGAGMTKEEFNRRWKTLCYDRLKEQGSQADSPPGTGGRERTAFGRSGKVRHGALCFSDEYVVESVKAGKILTARVTLTDGGTSPFACDIESYRDAPGHGTRIKASVERHLLSVNEIVELVGAKFAVDPSFSVSVNNTPVRLLELGGLISTELTIDGVGDITVHRLDASVQDRTAKLRGITWWVNNRMVGEPSWDGLDGEGHYLDGRTAEAKRFSFVVEANILKPDVKADWRGFHATSRSNAVREKVHDFVIMTLQSLFADTRRKEKKVALEQQRGRLRELPFVSKAMVGKFIDEVQSRCPTVSLGDLNRTVEIYTKLEQAGSGYDLLKQLAACAPEDLDKWNDIMSRWTGGPCRARPKRTRTPAGPDPTIAGSGSQQAGR